MLDLLVAAVRDGTGKAARLARPAAGKTGTTQDYRDAWFIGFTADVVVGVWVGNDDNSPMDKVVGGDLPAKIWHDFVAAADTTKATAAAAPQAVAAAAPSPPSAIRPVPSAPPAPPAAVTPLPPEAAPSSGAASMLRGAPVVVDTATLQIRGQTVRLLGVEGAGGRLAREMALYIGNRDIACEPAGAGRYRCRVDGYDLSEAVLFNGAGRAGPDAPPELQAAEQKARIARRGIWRQG
jgi:endonuclease YncB( thermonuclease family)